MFWLKVFYFTLTTAIIQSATINDEVCEVQLKYFDDALNARDHWALFGKLNLISRSLISFEILSGIKFLTRGQNFLRVFYEATLLIPVDLLIV